MFYQKSAISLAVAMAVTGSLVACGGSDGDGTTTPSTPTTPATPEQPLVMTPVNPIVACADMAKQDFSTLAEAPATVTSAVVDGKNCVVKGTISGRQNYQVALPIEGWTQRFLMAGCGGYCGGVNNPTTSQTFQTSGCMPRENNQMVIASSDLGHTRSPIKFADGSWAKDNPTATIDFAYLGMHRATVLSKALVKAYYGQEPKRSYYVGCSDGGREGLHEVQRYPEDYDGVVVSAPVIDEVATNTFYHGWNVRVNSDASGFPIFTAAKRPALAARVKQFCGDEGGLVQDPRLCEDRKEEILASLMCGNGPETDNCLTSAQADVVRKFWYGPVDEYGVRMSAGNMPLGSEAGLASAVPAGTPTARGEGDWADDFPNYMSNWGSGTGITWANMEFSLAGWNKLTPLSNLYDPTNPDLSRFAARGGKLIIWHGWADGGASPYMSLNYWTAVRNQMGVDAASKFMTLYMVPGIGHCSGNSDFLSPMLDWVEKGTAPGKISVRHTTPGSTTPLQTRPAYPYPSMVKYGGFGDMTAESSWVRADLPSGVSDVTAWRGLANYAPGKQMWCDPVTGSSTPNCTLK
ncbi:tannase/feruloyl esterase family alpha/beta hydrolase [Azohydromonas lata]|uniref:tannase/feruloyl esterase family alpha/beta hydrolase n=1 Tax=Azohydromonas lata TaxID=45677 RepID=UPI001EE42DDC|nr:tannase/feruloyl esterase family alpha/beta hydrolase [Azohydromonas lata]